MDTAQQEATARARELQRSWYGEPLGALFRRLIDDLGLNQARLAGVLGLSAPMLSQLMSGQRAKIGNPAVVQRVQSLQDLAGQVADGSVSAVEATERMEEIKKSQGGSVLSNTTTRRRPVRERPRSRRVVREIQSLLRSVAAAGDIIDAADSPRPRPPRTGRVPPGVRRGAHLRRRRALRGAPELTTAVRESLGGRAHAMGEVFAGRYELVDPIGRGGVGAVWRAWDHRRRRYVAAKVLQQSDAHALLRFVREQALRIDHPHVLAPASWAADDDKVLFTMDLVRGGSLAHLIGDYGPLPPRFVCVLLDQLLVRAGGRARRGRRAP